MVDCVLQESTIKKKKNTNIKLDKLDQNYFTTLCPSSNLWVYKYLKKNPKAWEHVLRIDFQQSLQIFASEGISEEICIECS